MIQRTYGLPRNFWIDDYVLGYLNMAIGLMAKFATHGNISTTDLGSVLIDVYTALSNMNGRAIGSYATELSSNPTPAFAQGEDDAFLVILFLEKKLKKGVREDIIRRAEELAKRHPIEIYDKDLEISNKDLHSSAVVWITRLTFVKEIKGRFGFVD
jgi:hypothetical protein